MTKGLLGDLEKELAAVKAKDVIPAIDHGNAQVTIRSKRVVDFTSWDFLGAGKDRAVVKAAQTAIEAYGIGVASPRLSAGTRAAHIESEIRLANFFCTESALLFSSKGQALISIITSLLHERDTLIVDDRFVGPAADAAYLVNSDVINFHIEQVQATEKIFENTKHYRRKICIAESVSSITGQPSDLGFIAKLCAKHGVELIVDESFALGTLGIRGAGGVEAANISRDILAVVSDLSLSLGVAGGVVAGPNTLTKCLLTRGRTFAQEGAPLPLCAKAAQAAIDYIELQSFKRESVKLLSQRLRQGLHGLGIAVGEFGTPIVSLPFKSIKAAEEAKEALFSRGFLVDLVPAGLLFSEASLLRLLITAEHKDEHIDTFLNAMSDIFPRIKN